MHVRCHYGELLSVPYAGATPHQSRHQPDLSDIDALITVIDATANFAMRECPRCHGFEVGDNADGTMHCDTCNVPVTPVKV